MNEYTIDYRATLLDQFEALKDFPMFQRMARTVEGSPWHREANVLVHTEMVVGEYVKFADELCAKENRPWKRRDYLAGMACVFHDTGKPESEIEKFSEARGKYRAYHGHELASARIFETYAAARFPMFSAYDIAAVCFLIEHHKPWEVSDPKKLKMLAQTAEKYGKHQFRNALLADQKGRTSDNKDVNYAKCEEWMEEFMQLDTTDPDQWIYAVSPKRLIMPIAPSGAGKSTYLAKIKEAIPDIQVFSLDALRLEFYDPNNYAKAYQGSVDDKNFETRANARYHEMLKEGTSIYVDNTNLSAKRRKFYLQASRKYGYSTTAVLMPVGLDVVLERQKTRGDKTVPKEAVIRQYKSLQVPQIGEFDFICVSDHNLTKQEP